MRYAVAYKRFEDDPMVFFEGNAICMFCQDKGTVEMLKKHYLVYISEKESADETYQALENAISKKIGERAKLKFTHGEPTVWKLCDCPKGYHDMFIRCRPY